MSIRPRRLSAVRVRFAKVAGSFRSPSGESQVVDPLASCVLTFSPYWMTAPIPATTKVLDRAGLTLDDVDLIEITAAFAAVVRAWALELQPDLDKGNVNGGAIAIGHPIGASGARVLNTLLFEMKRRDAKKGLATLCIGGGMGVAMCVERE